MNEVTAVCLTLGEETTERALESIRRQTLPVAETIVIEGVEPFHRAFNLGAARVETTFFVQVDADMVLDPTCVADLRAAIQPEVAIAAGLLRDPLLGKLPAVKLFRTYSLEGRHAPNTIASDVDQYFTLGDSGWLTLFVLSKNVRAPDARHTFGEHRPAYTAHYTWGTYFLLGSRCRYRRDTIAFRWRQAQLRRSVHRMAPLARVAFCEGLFCTETQDVSKAYPGTQAADLVETLLADSQDGSFSEPELERLLAFEGWSSFEQLYELGLAIGRASAGTSAKRVLELLTRTGGATWLAEIALCRGLLAHGHVTDVEGDYQHTCETLPI